MTRFLTVLSFCFLSLLSAKAQKDTWEAAIPEIPADGFYKIPLSPQVLAKAKNQFNRFRISESSTEVPYLIKTEAGIVSKSKTVNLPIIERKDEDSRGFIIFENPKAIRLSSLVMKIKRVWINKKLRISGSNDAENWFAVRSEFLLSAFQNSENSDETTGDYQIDIPRTDYKFYKIESNNHDDLSINVLSIGYVVHVKNKASLLALPEPQMSKERTEEPSASLFKFGFREPYMINQLVFKIKKPRFFQRNAKLYLADPRIKTALRKENNSFDSDPYKFFTLSSNDSVNTIFLENNSVASFFILIENQDNPPLDLLRVQAFQNKNFIQVYLEKGKRYTLKIGSAGLASPVYDLAGFQNQIEENIPVLTIGGLRKGPDANPINVAKDTFFLTKNWIWLGLFLVAALLVYMSIQMVKEMKNNG
ncbi:hypothetical protein ACFP1I_11695 [Dyadobacter subterraneus]|uniref:DUF3999 domain-containing protein n=1 Tax=Dyadobacter subterraneus TaxID=2773304 RepID=A0ABR9WDL5_9BACT|nr:hypothetical protein [Dyadobacter subterraneus]MBE9463586.1 hypothetical protein [Dyadobacter subterraneus]